MSVSTGRVVSTSSLIGELCAKHGLNAKDITVEGVTHQGYYTWAPHDRLRTFHIWPKDFPVDELFELAQHLHPEIRELVKSRKKTIV